MIGDADFKTIGAEYYRLVRNIPKGDIQPFLDLLNIYYRKAYLNTGLINKRISNERGIAGVIQPYVEHHISVNWII